MGTRSRCHKIKFAISLHFLTQYTLITQSTQYQSIKHLRLTLYSGTVVRFMHHTFMYTLIRRIFHLFNNFNMEKGCNFLTLTISSIRPLYCIAIFKDSLSYVVNTSIIHSTPHFIR